MSSIYPCGQNSRILCFHRVGVNIFSVLAARRTADPSGAEDESRYRSDTDRPPSPSPNIHTHFLACLVTMLRGGVTGRLPLGFFFSAGFKICKTALGVMRSADLLQRNHFDRSMQEAAYLKRAHEGLVHAHHGTGVVKLPAVIRC